MTVNTEKSMRRRLPYDAPACEIASMCAEGSVLQASAGAYNLGGGGHYDDLTTNQNGEY